MENQIKVNLQKKFFVLAEVLKNYYGISWQKFFLVFIGTF